MTIKPKIIRHRIPGSKFDQMRETIRVIGRAIRAASTYLPLRNHAAALATKAPPKDYLRQVHEIWKDCLKRWRYVKDPVSRELVTYSPEAIWQLVLAGDGVGLGRGYGGGDCDCVSIAIGAQLEAIGMPVRIAITAPQNAPPGKMFAHVFVQCRIPKIGWLTVDPVVHPNQGFGATPKHSRIAYFNLDGILTGYRGNVVGMTR